MHHMRIKKVITLLICLTMIIAVIPYVGIPVNAAITVLYPVEWKFQTKGTRFNNLRNTENPENIDYHNGLDISATQGTNIYAVYDGTVEFSGWKDSYGNFVVLYHPALSVYTFYAHASSLVAKQGSSVKQGDVIAKVGSTGNSTGPHLHFGICSRIENGWPRRTYYDPETYFNYTPTPGPVDPQISISGFQNPVEGYVHTPGTACGMYGTITSNNPLKHVWGGVYNLDGTKASGKSTTCDDYPNSTTYSLRGTFNEAIYFNDIPQGSYYFSLSAEDSTGYKKELIHNYFTVGNKQTVLTATPSSVTINKGNNETKTVTIYQDAPCESVTISYEHGSSEKTVLEWKDWDSTGHSIGLAISGKESGTETIKIHLYNSENDALLKTISITATVVSSNYSIAFNANGGTGSMSDQTMTLDIAANLTANTFKKDGYTFLGWSTDKSATTAKYTDKQSVKNLTTTAGGKVTLYAIWTVNKLKIHYNVNGGSLASDTEYYLTDSGDVYSKETKDFAGNTWNYGSGGSAGLYNASTFKLSRTGYTFLGWSTQKSGGTVYDQDDTTLISQNLYPDLKTKSGTVLMYAQWEPKTVKVTFHRNKNSSDTDTVTETFTYGTANQKFGYKTDGTGQYKKMNDPSVGFGEWVNTGYSLLGWNTDKAATAKGYSTYSGVSDSWINSNAPTIDLYAVWSINSVKVRYNTNGGMITDTSEFYADDNGNICLTETQAVRESVWTYNYKNKNGLPNASSFKLSKTSYKFLGWSTAKTGGTIFDQDDVNVTTSDFFPDIATKSGEVTLYARWELALPETLKLRNGWKYDLGLSDENYTYASNNTKVAIVSTSGVITAIGVGEATISVVDADSNSVQITVTVYPVMEGDINLDGKVTIADAVLLQKWLLAVPNTVLPDWKAGDMNGDGRLNVVDLTLLKRLLMK